MFEEVSKIIMYLFTYSFIYLLEINYRKDIYNVTEDLIYFFQINVVLSILKNIYKIWKESTTVENSALSL